jgi:hypothetical protein
METFSQLLFWEVLWVSGEHGFLESEVGLQKMVTADSWYGWFWGYLIKQSGASVNCV